MKEYTLAIYEHFRISIDYNSFDGEIYGRPILKDFIFDSDYYLSNEFYGMNSGIILFSYLYSRLLNDVKKSHEAILSLSLEEIS